MNDFGALILAVALVLGLFFGLRFFILWKAKKVIGRNFTDLSEGIVYFYSPNVVLVKGWSRQLKSSPKKFKF